MILLSVASIRKYLWFSVRNHFHKVRIVRLIYPISLSAIVEYDLSNCWYGGKASTAWTAYVNRSQDKVVWLHSGTRTWTGGVLFVNNISRDWEAFMYGTVIKNLNSHFIFVMQLLKKCQNLFWSKTLRWPHFRSRKPARFYSLKQHFYALHKLPILLKQNN